MAGEFDFIRWLRDQSSEPSHDLPVPPGDDMAVLRWPGHDLLLIAADQVLDGRHFDSKLHSPKEIGRKVMLRNLSDCAAMAALPAAAVVTVALPPTADLNYAKDLYLGLREAADPWHCPIVGGDTGSWPNPLAVSLTLLARSAGIQPLTRDGARPGDLLYVTGPLGGSILGRHLRVTPRIHEARQLARTGKITSMIDLSDGLSRDLAHLCPTYGAQLESAQIPLHPDAIELAKRTRRPPLEHALHDGEDHELLFTASAPVQNAVLIGRIIEQPGLYLDAKPLKPQGWEHPIGRPV